MNTGASQAVSCTLIPTQDHEIKLMSFFVVVLQFITLCVGPRTLPTVARLTFSPLSSQQWTKTGSHIEHIASHLCLDTDMFGDSTEAGTDVVVNPCESSLMSQHWDMMSS